MHFKSTLAALCVVATLLLHVANVPQTLAAVTTVRPYKFGFNVAEQQHRSEQRDEKGIVMGEFGFITADGIYHVTVYATDEEGKFRILAMRSYPYETPPKTINMIATAKELKVQPPVTSRPTPAPTKRPAPVAAAPAPKSSLPKYNFHTPGCSGCFLGKTLAEPQTPTPADVKTNIRPLSQALPSGVAGAAGGSPSGVAGGSISSAAGGKSSFPSSGASSSGGSAAGGAAATGKAARPSTAGKPSAPATSNASNKKSSSAGGSGGSGSFGNSAAGKSSGGSGSSGAIKPSAKGSGGSSGSVGAGGGFAKAGSAAAAPRAQGGSKSGNGPLSFDLRSSGPGSGKSVGSSGGSGGNSGRIGGGGSGGSGADGGGDLYRFKYVLDYNGHSETGSHNGNKEGNYFALGEDNVERKIEYVANEFGYQPRINWKHVDAPKTKENTLKEYEFVWFNKPKWEK